MELTKAEVEYARKAINEYLQNHREMTRAERVVDHSVMTKLTRALEGFEEAGR
jgi:hypothetical protein